MATHPKARSLFDGPIVRALALGPIVEHLLMTSAK